MVLTPILNATDCCIPAQWFFHPSLVQHTTVYQCKDSINHPPLTHTNTKILPSTPNSTDCCIPAQWFFRPSLVQHSPLYTSAKILPPTPNSTNCCIPTQWFCYAPLVKHTIVYQHYGFTFLVQTLYSWKDYTIFK